MRRRIIITLAGVTATAMVAVPSAAEAKTYIFPRLDRLSFGYQRQQYKPRQITLSTTRVVGINWAGWGNRRAIGVGHVLDEPRDYVQFVASDIVTNARVVRACKHEHPVRLIRYYRRLVAHAQQREYRVVGNQATVPTTQCK